MDVPMDAKVELLDGDGGHTTRVLLNPISKKITHLIVREPGWLGMEREVPIELVVESTPERVRLRLTRDDLAALPALEETRYIPAPELLPPYSPELLPPYPPELLPPYPPELLPYSEGAILAWPYYPVDGLVPVIDESIPLGELAVHRGQRVEAVDGRVGRIDEFLVDPVSERITHLRMREGHLWGRREVTIPVGQIDRIEDEVIYLKLNKRQVEELSTVSARA